MGGWGGGGGGGVCHASYTFPLRITCKKGVGWGVGGGGGVQIACKIAYVLNGRPLIRIPNRNILLKGLKLGAHVIQ